MTPLRTLLRRWRHRLLLPADCGMRTVPLYDDPAFARGAVSPDQARMLDAVLPRIRRGDRVLHVGIGCSDVARRLPDHEVDGVTVLEEEIEVAVGLALPRYRVYLQDKYRALDVPGDYAWILDNNPGSYACCRRHLHAYFRGCATALAPGGRMVTDVVGAGWVSRNGVPISRREWEREGRRLGLVPETLAEGVWAWRRG